MSDRVGTPEERFPRIAAEMPYCFADISQWMMGMFAVSGVSHGLPQLPR